MQKVSDIRFSGMVLALAFMSAGCSSPQTVNATDNRERSLRIERIDAAMANAARFMIEKQSPDGAWRSETYGCFKGGSELTPLILNALFFIPQGGQAALESFRRGVTFLVKMVDSQGNIRIGPRGLNFPVYTSAIASWVIVKEKKTKEHLRARDAWVAYLRGRQLNRSLGWKPSDPEFGGWGFSLDPPKKPEPGQLKGAFFESNLSATIFGVGALSSVGIGRDDPVWKDVLTFVRRCQNSSDDPSRTDPRFDDGGFFFIPNDAVQNKAGLAGFDRFGSERYHSYGSMTGDGLRALLQCGLKPDHPRVLAARKWLENNFSAKTHPGNFDESREVLREATYYYYVWSISHALTRLGLVEVETRNGRVKWAEVLADELINRQKPDGSWVNSYTDAKEDDPLISTPWVVTALAFCRKVITDPKGQDYPHLTSRT